MKLLLLNPPNHLYDQGDLAPPLGLMCLARVARLLGYDVELLDLNLVSLEWKDDPNIFFKATLDLILNSNVDVLALTSMGVNSHVSLMIAKLVKLACPVITTVVGGVHFSSIANEISSLFPYIDHVIVGVGEDNFHQLLINLDSSLCRKLSQTTIQHDQIQSHPHSCYDLVDLEKYFARNERRVINYQNGYGCTYRCRFCYSPNFYNRLGYARIEDSVEDLLKIRQIGANHVFFVQDNLINNPDWASEFLTSLASSDFDLTWNCYISIPRLTKRLLAQLAEAGCVSIYLGLDAVTKSQKKVFGKSFFEEGNTFQLLNYAKNQSVIPICAFIVDIYRYDICEIESTLQTALSCALMELPVRINTFTRYQNTGLDNTHTQAVYSEQKVRLMMDCPEVVNMNHFAQNFPNLFPFHATEIDPNLWHSRLTVIYVANIIISSQPEIIRLVAKQRNDSLVNLFEQFVNNLPSISSISKLGRKAWVREQFIAYS